ncbi:hypothetical protein HYH03_014903 [Edaphochlamys debaryana]|uniref:SET domain-containing protein n=1 Tax=Edaphochlamys debaryana TaxID=47281 RepID=A0A835XQK2_9CHLO|nr:hypothetical protein HYH03_014903 [Edaphochlamys debaryana]|eukprot:KAG2486456.1 hypothetical protein HYH03_014903 [Edaphochlamys debaryana]
MVEVAVADEPDSWIRRLRLRLWKYSTSQFFASGLQAWLALRGARVGDHMRLRRLSGGGLELSLIPAAEEGSGEAEGRRQPAGSAVNAFASVRLPAVRQGQRHTSGPAASRPLGSSEGCDGTGGGRLLHEGGSKRPDAGGSANGDKRGRTGAAHPGEGLGPEAAPPDAPAPVGRTRGSAGSGGGDAKRKREGSVACGGRGPGRRGGAVVRRFASLPTEEARVLFPGIDTSSKVKATAPFRLAGWPARQDAGIGQATLASNGSTLRLYFNPSSALEHGTLLRLWREGGTLVVERGGQHGEAGAGGAVGGGDATTRSVSAGVPSATFALAASALLRGQLHLPRAATEGPLKPLLAGAQGQVAVDVLATDQGSSASRRLRLEVHKHATRGDFSATGLGPWLRERGAAAGDSLRLAWRADGSLRLHLSFAEPAAEEVDAAAGEEAAGVEPEQLGVEVLLAGNGRATLQAHEAQALLTADEAAAVEAARAGGAPLRRRLPLQLLGAAARRRPAHEATLVLQYGVLRLHFKLCTLQALGQPAALRLRREGGFLQVRSAAAPGLQPDGTCESAVWALSARALTKALVFLPAAAVRGPLRIFLDGKLERAEKVDVQVAVEPGRVLTVRISQDKDGPKHSASGLRRWLRERGAPPGDRLRLSLLADGSLELSLLPRAAGQQQPAAAEATMPRTASEASPRQGPSPAQLLKGAPTGKRRREEGAADQDQGGSGAEGEAGGSRRAAHPSRAQGAAAAVLAGTGSAAQPSEGAGAGPSANPMHEAAAGPHAPSACMAAPLLRKRVALSPAQAQALGLRGPGGACAQGPLPLRVAGGEAGPSAGGCPGAAHTVTLEEREGALVLRLGRQARKALGAAEALWLWREGGGLAASPAPASAAEEAAAASEAGTEPGAGGSQDLAPEPRLGQVQDGAAESGPEGGGQGEGSGPCLIPRSSSGPPSVAWPLDQPSVDHRPFLPASVTLGPLQPLLHGRPSARVHVAVADQPGRPLALRVKQEAGTGRYRARGLRGWLRERGARAGDLLTLTRLPEGGLVLRLDHQAGTAPEAAPEPPTTAPEPGAQGRDAAPSDANAPSFAALAAQLPTCGKRPPEGGTAGQAEAMRARKKEKGGDRAKGRRSPTQPHPLGESPPLLPAPSLSAAHLRPYLLPPSAPAAPPALQPGELRLCGLTFHPALAPAVRRSLAAWEAALCEQLRGEGLDGGLSDAAPEALQVCVLDGARLREAGIQEYVVRCQLAHLLGLADAFDKDLPPHAPQLGPDRLAPGPDAGLFAAAGLRKGAVLGVLGGYVMPGAEARRFAARGWQALGAEARAELGARAGGGAAASGGGAGQHVRSTWQLLEGSMRLPMPGSPDGWQLSMLGYGSLAALMNDPRRQPRGWLEGSDVGDEEGAAARAANCTVVPVRVRGLALPVVVAVRDVAPGEQLLRDYGAEWWREREEAWWCVEEMDAVLWALLRGGYRWRLAQPGRDAYWGRRTEGAPTLRLPGPVVLEVERVGAGGGGMS